jgi:hypothetical protein
MQVLEALKAQLPIDYERLEAELEEKVVFYLLY